MPATARPAPRDGDDRHETESARLDRNYEELLQELRVAQTGVQILFAFLLTLPFQYGFTKTSGLDRTVFILTLLCATVATALLIAPVGFHRRVFRQGRKGDLVHAASSFALAGLAALALAMSGALFVVTDVVLGLGWAAGLAAAAFAVLIFFWYFAPVFWGRRRARTGPGDQSSADGGRGG
ncbi:hypothetical protein EDD29_6855 [Actinocorallia herbida]|uniref:Sodium:proton antiporter n=1 Tax=Actinocorallia herbida TaxID=58109 RepID=A0A3N1D7S0_9ACTN|nr:DUF6328 family protein [Actinocorallia herbida]ROO89168.1 hypothetical protein EDD29_6855 [Actinocorallia herbida]